MLYGSVAEPTRRVYFSFHYQNDIQRLMQVRNHWVTKETRKAAGFFDGSLEEKAKTEGSIAVKRAINAGMVGSSVTCVVIGSETYQRHWVRYEILKSIEQGMGVFGVRVHQLKNLSRQTAIKGPDPFDWLGYSWNDSTGKLKPVYWDGRQWLTYTDADTVPTSAAKYLVRDSFKLSRFFSVYDWVDDNGYDNFSSWVAAAARQAGR